MSNKSFAIFTKTSFLINLYTIYFYIEFHSNFAGMEDDKNIIRRPGPPTIWTLDKVTELASIIRIYVEEHTDCYTMGEAIVNCGAYEDLINVMTNKYGKFEDIIIAKDIIKNRCLKAGMTNKTNATMTIFNLVNNFGMVNTNVKSDITSKGEQVRSIPAINWVDSPSIEDAQIEETKLLNDENKKIDPKND